MSHQYNEIRKELDKYEKTGQELNHGKALDKMADLICQTKDAGRQKELIEWSKKNSPPDGLGFCVMQGDKMVNSWWFHKMSEDLK